jgi:outer membrane protein OmpA-like peptidoglycan-associated protein
LFNITPNHACGVQMKRNSKFRSVIAICATSLSILQVGAPAASAVASNTTTTIAVSDPSPSIGDVVTFTVTVTPTTFSSTITGNIVVTTGGNTYKNLCATSDLIEDPSTHVVTGTCTWKSMSGIDAVTANYKGDSRYNASNSAALSPFSVLGVTELQIPRMTVGSTGNTLEAWVNTTGNVTFKVDGQVISGCASKAVSNGGATCSYNLPTPTTAFGATHLFSVDFTPTGKTQVVNQFSKPFTPDTYYLPNGDNIFQSTTAGFVYAATKQPYVDAGYIEVDHIFYKLNRSTMEAMAVGYDQYAGLTKLNFPEILNVTTAAVPGKTEFAGAYGITAIGAWAFQMSSQSQTHTLLTEVTFPSTLKVIGERSFAGQCGIASLDLPDSVLYVGQTAFAAMNNTGAINQQGYAGCTGPSSTGLVNIKFGAGLIGIGPQVFNGDGNIQAISFRGSPADLKSLHQFHQSGLEMWQITHYWQNANMYPFTELTNGSCLGNVSYAGNLQVNVLATQSTAWQYWAQGCLTGTLNVQATLFKPSRPAAPVLSAATYTTATVNFTAPISNGGDTITAYSVEYSSDNFATWETATASLSSASSPYVITGLTPSTAYRVRVIAKNSIGASVPSQASAPLLTLTPSIPGAPVANSAVLATNTAVTVAFTAPGSDGGASIESYTVVSTPDSVVAYSVGSGNGSATLTGLRPGITYTFIVRAGNSAGQSLSSNSVSIKIPKSPVLGAWANISKNKSDAPFLLTPPSESYTAAGTFSYSSSNSGIASISGDTVTVVQSGSAVITATFYPTDTATYLSGVTKTMTISVSAASNSITFGSITSRAVNSGSFNLTATALGGTITYSTATSASICSVTNGGAVSIFSPGTCVITASTLGNANYGAAADVTQSLVITAAPPGAPTLTSVSVGGTDATVSTSGYATLQFTANTQNGGSITSYVITAIPSTGSAITKTVTAGAGTHTDSITALSLGEAYTFSVTAYNGATTGGGTSAASNAVVKTPAANPNAPTNLRVTSGNTTLTANWTPPVSLGGGTWDSYRVFIKRSSDTSFPETPTAVINTQGTSTYQFTGLTNGVAYDVKIWVKTTSFTTELLANTAAVYLIPATVPVAPRFAISQTDSTTVVASWESNGDGGSVLTGYTLTLSSGTCAFTFVSGTTAYTCSVAGLTPGSTVNATLLATNGVGSSSAASSSVNYITSVGAPTLLVPTNGDGQATISFSINTGGDTIVSYDYSLDGLSYSPINATSSPVTIMGLTNGLAYNIYLRAKGATYGDGPRSASVEVLPRVTPVAVSAPTGPVVPSRFNVLVYPSIAIKDGTYVCSRGNFEYLRSGIATESAKYDDLRYQLLINGAVVESTTSTTAQATFEITPLFEDSTISCSVLVSQEGTIAEFASTENGSQLELEKAKRDSYQAAANEYQIKRDAAYALRVEGDSASIATWRKSLDAALAVRNASEELAQKTYLAALEKAGISIFYKPVAISKPTTPIAAKEPEKVNVQPTKVMRKVGTVYFASGTYFINDKSRRTIEAIAKKISTSDAQLILSYGHTDASGGVNNTLLSKNRARAVAALLKSSMIGKKIVTGWYAATKPLGAGKSKEALAKNRRVEIYIK